MYFSTILDFISNITFFLFPLLTFFEIVIYCIDILLKLREKSETIYFHLFFMFFISFIWRDELALYGCMMYYNL